MAIDTTKINGKALSAFGATLLSYDTGAVTFSGNYFKAEKRLQPTVFPANMPLRDIVLRCEFSETTDEGAEMKATELTADLTALSEIYLPDGFYYRGVLTKMAKPKRISTGIFTRDYTITAYRHGSKKSHTMSVSENIEVTGNYKTAAKYTITMTAGTEFILNGISITGITGSVIIIDGIEGKVTEDGANCFDKTDMTKFPELQPGTNYIAIDGNGSVQVEYFPIYY